MELVSAPPYYQEPISEWYEPNEEFVGMGGQPSISYMFETNSMMLLAPMLSRMQQYPPWSAALSPLEVKCYECGGNHYTRYCPN